MHLYLKWGWTCLIYPTGTVWESSDQDQNQNPEELFINNKAF